MRRILTIFGVLLLLLGAWWIGQGTGLIPVGFMASQMHWAYVGGGVFALGLIVLVLARRA